MSDKTIKSIIPTIPETWIYDKIKHHVQDKPNSIVDGPFGTQLHNDEYVDEGIPVIRIVNLSYEGNFDPEKLVFITQEKYQSLKRSSVEPGDLIIAKTGATIGKVGVFEGYEKGIIASSCLKITLNENISSNFFKYYLISDYCQNQIILSSSGSTRDTINMEQIANLQLALPTDINTQKQIANYLDKQTAKIDETISKNKQLIDLLEEKRVALINQVVTKGLNPEVPMKDSGIEWIGAIPEQWEVIKLKFCTDIINNKKDYADASDKYIGLEHIESETGRLLSHSNEGADGTVNKFEKNMVLFGKLRPYLAKVINTSFDGVCSTELLVFKVKKNLIPKFLFYVMLSNRFIEQVNSSTYGVKMPRASPDFINSLPIGVPNKIEQNEIVNYLDSKISNINKTISKIQENIELLEEYKTSLIHHVVTGKIDVRGEEL